MNKIMFTATLLTIAFTLSCSSGSGDNDDTPSSSSLAQTSSSFSDIGQSMSSSSAKPSSSSEAKILCGVTYYSPATQFCDARDYKVYKFVKIGTQTWMAENLNFNAPGSKCGDEDRRELVSINTSFCDKYGRFYDWPTAMAGSASSTASPSRVKGVCPEGWHIPSDAEWETLINFAGGKSIAGTKLRSASDWAILSDCIAGTDDFGFSALPGGFGNSYGQFDIARNYTYGFWWSSSEYSSSEYYDAYLYAYHRRMTCDPKEVLRDYGDKISSLYSVRCLQD